MRWERPIALGLFLTAMEFTLAFGDIAPRPGYVERCTIPAHQNRGQECRACLSSFQGRKDCDQLAEQGYSHVCRGYGASVWQEVWCRQVSEDRARRTTVLRDSGRVASVTIPSDWTSWQGYASSRPYMDTSFPASPYIILKPPARQDVFLRFSMHGDGRDLLDDALLQRFKGLLSSPAGSIKKADLERVTLLVTELAYLNDRQSGQKFLVKEARIEKTNAYSALIVQGNWARDRRHSLTWHIDAIPCGKVIQQIEYQAPEAIYGHYLQTVKSAFSSIVWQPVAKKLCR